MTMHLAVRAVGEEIWEDVLNIASGDAGEEFAGEAGPLAWVWLLPTRPGFDEDEDLSPTWVLDASTARERLSVRESQTEAEDPEIATFFEKVDFLLRCGASEIELCIQ